MNFLKFIKRVFVRFVGWIKTPPAMLETGQAHEAVMQHYCAMHLMSGRYY